MGTSIILGLINMLGMGLANSIAKKPIQALGEVNFLVKRTQLTSLGLFIVLVFYFLSANFNFIYIIFSLFLSFIVYLGMMFMYQSFKVGKLGVVSPIASSYPLISIFLTVIFFHVNISYQQVLAILIIFLGVIMCSLNFHDFKKSLFFDRKSGILQAMLASILMGSFFFLSQFPNRELGPYLSSFIFEIGMLFCAVTHSFFLPKVDEKQITKKVNLLIYVVAILSVLAIVFFYFGLRFYNAPVILASSGASPLVVLVYGSLVYREKLSVKQIIASGLMIVGIILLSLK